MPDVPTAPDDGRSSGAGEHRGPEHDLARALAPGLRADFPGREDTALHLAELILDATEPALSLARGGPAEEPLAELELLAMRIDVYAWDGAPGWDEVLSRGLAGAERRPGVPSPLPG